MRWGGNPKGKPLGKGPWVHLHKNPFHTSAAPASAYPGCIKLLQEPGRTGWMGGFLNVALHSCLFYYLFFFNKKIGMELGNPRGRCGAQSPNFLLSN